MRSARFAIVLLACFFCSLCTGSAQTPTPSVTVTPSATPTATPDSGSPTPIPSATPSGSVTPMGSATPIPSATPTGSATPTPSATPISGGTATPTPGSTTSQLLNISTRAQLQTGDQVLIGGFVITGTNGKTVVVRAIGPSLGKRGVAGAVADPMLQLFDADGVLLAQNDNWKDAQQTDIIATGIPPTDDREAAIVLTLTPSSYTAVMEGKNGGTGIGLVEVYDLDSTVGSVLANISSRGLVGTGNNVLIGGLIIGPSGTSANVVVRAIGPSLGASNVSGALQDPTLELHDGNGVVIAANDNWRDAQEIQIQSTGLAPVDNRESAIFTTLLAGNYTAIVRGRNQTTGVALVEVYQVP